jgi:hypothetical protein
MPAAVRPGTGHDGVTSRSRPRDEALARGPAGFGPRRSRLAGWYRGDCREPVGRAWRGGAAQSTSLPRRWGLVAGDWRISDLVGRPRAAAAGAFGVVVGNGAAPGVLRRALRARPCRAGGHVAARVGPALPVMPDSRPARRGKVPTDAARSPHSTRQPPPTRQGPAHPAWQDPPPPEFRRSRPDSNPTVGGNPTPRTSPHPAQTAHNHPNRRPTSPAASRLGPSGCRTPDPRRQHSPWWRDHRRGRRAPEGAVGQNRPE